MLEKEIHAEEVAEYLNQNRQFFHVFPDLLNELSVPHPKTGGEISLLERQVHNLRQQKEALEIEIEMLKDIAGENAQLLQKVMAFSEALIRAETLQEGVDTIYQQMREVFQVPYVTLFSWELPQEQLAGLHQLGMSQKWLQTLKLHLAPQKPMCGQVENEWQSGLFPKTSGLVKSTCILPLGNEKIWGVLALGSDEPQRYHETQGTYFLKVMARMMTARLSPLFEV